MGEAKFHQGRHLKLTVAFRHFFANAPKQQNRGQHVDQTQIRPISLRIGAEWRISFDGVNCQKYTASVVYKWNTEYGSLVERQWMTKHVSTRKKKKKHWLGISYVHFYSHTDWQWTDPCYGLQCRHKHWLPLYTYKIHPLKATIRKNDTITSSS